MPPNSHQDLTIGQRAAERGRRIEAELKRAGWTIAELRRRVIERVGATRGTSAGAIRNYLKGTDVDHPRSEIVRAMAEALGVNCLYLMDLKGPRAPEDAAVRNAARLTDGDERRLAAVDVALRAIDRAELPFPREYLIGEMSTVLTFGVVRLLETGGARVENYSEAELQEAAELVAWLWALPLNVTQASASASSMREFWLAAAVTWSHALSVRRQDASADELVGPLKRLRDLGRGVGAVIPSTFMKGPEGLWWAAYCPSDAHDPSRPVAMAIKPGANRQVFVCPECGHEAPRKPPPPAGRRSKNVRKANRGRGDHDEA